jgi:hypothetical protein
VRFPPGSVFADPSFDAEAAQQEALVRLRRLADHFERDKRQIPDPVLVAIDIHKIAFRWSV